MPQYNIRDVDVLITYIAVTDSPSSCHQSTPNMQVNTPAVHVQFIIIMVALCNRADHYIFALLFLSSSIFFFSSPNLSGRRLDVYHISTHGVTLVRI